MKLNPDKQHIIFYSTTAELEEVVIPRGEMVIITKPGRIDFEHTINAFNNGAVRIIAIHRRAITGWRTTKTSEQADVHYTYPVSKCEKAQGDNRLLSLKVAAQRRAAEERAEAARKQRIKGRSIYGE